ncbi:MAG: hypothetical protein PVJ04_02370 [Gemmatimonadota bacterium]|jgi:hypothetical protein
MLQSGLLLDRERRNGHSVFGQVSIPSGPVGGNRCKGLIGISGTLTARNTIFELTNTGPDAVEIVSVYTSCMCTAATLGFPDGAREGPFGMPGHELPIALERVLAGGQLATVTVRFNPAAHGPEAVGPVKRAVAVRTAGGSVTVLSLLADVVADRPLALSA